MNQKIIVITGATQGIGYAIAKKMVAAGATIIAISRDKDSFHNLQKELGNSCIVYQADLSNNLEVVKCGNTICNDFPRIDWFIHSAGFIDEQTPEDIISTYSINIFSLITLSRIFTPHLRDQGGILPISSTSGIWGNERYPVYSSSKAAVIIFSKSLAKLFLSSSPTLSCVCICPGPTNTEMRERVAHDAIKHQNPIIIADQIELITSSKSTYKNGDCIIIRNSITTIHDSIT